MKFIDVEKGHIDETQGVQNIVYFSVENEHIWKNTEESKRMGKNDPSWKHALFCKTCSVLY